MRGILFGLAALVAAVPAVAQESGWIGVSIEDQKDRGAIIQLGPLLEEGDVIIEFNRQEVMGVQQLTRLVRETPVGRTVDVKVLRDSREQTFKVTTERGSGLRSGRFELDVPGVHILADRLARDFPKFEMNTVYVQGGVRVEQ